MNEPVCLTNKDVVDFCQRQQNVEDSLKNITEAVARIEECQKDYRQDIERRVRDLEKFKSIVVGCMLVITTILGIVGKSVWDMYINYPQQIKESIQEELSGKYNIDIE